METFSIILYLKFCNHVVMVGRNEECSGFHLKLSQKDVFGQSIKPYVVFTYEIIVPIATSALKRQESLMKTTVTSFKIVKLELYFVTLIVCKAF